MTKEGTKATAVVNSGRPSEQIVSVAGSEGCDFIARSTQDLNMLTHGIRDSVTDSIVMGTGGPT